MPVNLNSAHGHAANRLLTMLAVVVVFAIATPQPAAAERVKDLALNVGEHGGSGHLVSSPGARRIRLGRSYSCSGAMGHSSNAVHSPLASKRMTHRSRQVLPLSW